MKQKSGINHSRKRELQQLLNIDVLRIINKIAAAQSVEIKLFE